MLASVNFPLELLPMLEVVQTITEPLLAKLRFHFASGRPTDRIDQPDWLFDTAAKATEKHLESFKLLQPALVLHGLDKVFFMPFEFARAMHAAVQTVLREHVLPRLAQQVWSVITSISQCVGVTYNLKASMLSDTSQIYILLTCSCMFIHALTCSCLNCCWHSSKHSLTEPSQFIMHVHRISGTSDQRDCMPYKCL